MNLGHFKFTRHRVITTGGGEDWAYVELEHQESGRKFEGAGRNFLVAANMAMQMAVDALTRAGQAAPPADQGQE